MNNSEAYVTINGDHYTFTAGESIMSVATRQGIYIPYLCHHPNLPPHGSCKLCTVVVDDKTTPACTTPAEEGMVVNTDTPELQALRCSIIQMLFVDGNHNCPGCERTGSCQLQATAYELGMTDSHFGHQYPSRHADTSHPDIMLDRDRCILCGLCVRASEQEGKSVFTIAGRGPETHLAINTDSGLLVDSDIALNDLAMNICPVGALLVKDKAFTQPIGQRLYDTETIRMVGHLNPIQECENDG